MIRKFSGSLLVLFLAAGVADAGEVTVKGVHLCCGACVKGVTKVLPEAKVDRAAKTVTVEAASAAAAGKVVATLAGAGFGGKATFEGKEIAFPDSGVEKAKKADSVTFTGVHLCCGACVKGANKALADVGEVSVDRAAGTCTVTGEDIDPSKVFDALMAGGFYGTLK